MKTDDIERLNAILTSAKNIASGPHPQPEEAVYWLIDAIELLAKVIQEARDGE